MGQIHSFDWAIFHSYVSHYQRVSWMKSFMKSFMKTILKTLWNPDLPNHHFWILYDFIYYILYIQYMILWSFTDHKNQWILDRQSASRASLAFAALGGSSCGAPGAHDCHDCDGKWPIVGDFGWESSLEMLEFSTITNFCAKLMGKMRLETVEVFLGLKHRRWIQGLSWFGMTE